VQLISHLTRDFGSFDIFPIDATTVQLACVYETADGEQIGGIYTFLPVAADHCTATPDSFTCTD
jgi:anti-sigma regulatory factor (Ser/Thr protein kinase)